MKGRFSGRPRGERNRKAGTHVALGIVALVLTACALECAAQTEEATQETELSLTSDLVLSHETAGPAAGRGFKLSGTNLFSPLREVKQLARHDKWLREVKELGRHDKWLRVGLIWTAFTLDAISTHAAMKSNPDARELNPLFRDSKGKAKVGLYIGVMAPVTAMATYGNIRFPNNRRIRILTYVINSVKLGIAFHNFSGGHSAQH
mgnify:CR=1 FL=1